MNNANPYTCQTFRQKLKSMKLLVVGAGGIGCEVLKNLVLCGFLQIDIVSTL